VGTVTVERNGTGMRPGTEPRPSGLPSEAERRLTVERLDRSWIGRAADVLALSFADGPETSYILGGTPRRRQRVFRSLFRGLMWGYWRVGEAHGAILDGRAEGDLRGLGAIGQLVAGRAIADLDGAPTVGRVHLAEALGYRTSGERLLAAA